MTRTSILSLALAVFLAAACSLAMSDSNSSASAKTNPDHAAVEAAVAAFASATETRSAAAIDAILHANYRAIVNDFPTAGKVAELPRAAYTGMLASEKIGGKAYELQKRSISVQGNVANAVYDFVGDDQTMHQNLIFFRSGAEGAWQLVTSAPVVVKE